MANINPFVAYATSFGSMPDRTRYVDFDVKSLLTDNVTYSSDFRENMFGQDNVDLKSLQTGTGGPGSTDKVLVPIYLDPKVIDVTRKETPLVELVPRVSNMGITADFNLITGKGDGEFYGEGADFGGANADTHVRRSYPIKYLKIEGEVTGQALAALPSYALAQFQPQGSVALQNGVWSDQSAPNAMQLETLIKVRSLRELEENAIINGDSSSNELEFDGLIKQIGSNNQIDKLGAAFDLADVTTVTQLAFDNGGRPNLAICSSGVYTAIINALTQLIRYTPVTKTVAWGFQTIVLNTMNGDVPVIPSRFMSNTEDAKAIYFLDMSVIEMRVLQDMTYEELAKVKDARPFFLKIYECLIVRAPQFCASIVNID